MRSLLNLVYSLCVEGLDDEGRADFDAALMALPRDAAEARTQTMRELASMGIGEVG